MNVLIFRNQIAALAVAAATTLLVGSTFVNTAYADRAKEAR